MSDSIERLGEYLVRVKVLDVKQVREILEYQKDHPDILFGQIAIRLGFITQEQLDLHL